MFKILQPIMAFFRPHPGASGRSLFNWAHWGVGNTALILAIVAIFLAGTLAKTNLASNTWWVWAITAYVIFHFLVHIVFSILMAREERSGKVRDTQMQVMNGKVGQPDYDETEAGEHGSSVRKFMLVLYMAGAWGLVIALSVAVFLAY